MKNNKIKLTFAALLLLFFITGKLVIGHYGHVLLDVNGGFLSILQVNSYYGDRGVFITDDKYIVSPANETSTDYEYNELISFNEFLKENNVGLLYVNKPTKYNDDTFFYDNFGYDSYCNRNADKFLKRINDAGIDYIDLRDNMRLENISCEDLFYRTDHHWTVKAGLWASNKIADKLNADYGYSIDTSLLDIENFSVNEWENCWLGEQGALLSESYVGLDDYTELKPNYDTSFIFEPDTKKSKTDTFEYFINEDVYQSTGRGPSWHYSYRRYGTVNNKIESGNILLLCDSYDNVVAPFLALGVHRVEPIVLRDCEEDFDLKKYILENDFDTVVISYAEFMIGAHDDESNANFKMFTFE